MGCDRRRRQSLAASLSISTHTSRVGCDYILQNINRNHIISTHTSRVGCDTTLAGITPFFSISTHTSRVGCDAFHLFLRAATMFHFYSHIPCGMWLTCLWCFPASQHFYSHIPCGMWPVMDCLRGYMKGISTHTSRVGCDGKMRWWIYFPVAFLLTHPVWDVTKSPPDSSCNFLFLLTHPVWDVTMMPSPTTLTSIISTHTSRVGCDKLRKLIADSNVHFYSHIPCGMWRKDSDPYIQQQLFLLTHPVWDVTINRSASLISRVLSTHTSRVGCDTSDCRVPVALHNFYSHIPCGMWRQ